MSNISKAVADQVENFHKRQLSERYAVIFMDATYLNVRRDSVAKEPLHVLLGIRRMEPEKFWITHSIQRRPRRITRR